MPIEISYLLSVYEVRVYGKVILYKNPPIPQTIIGNWGILWVDIFYKNPLITIPLAVGLDVDYGAFGLDGL